MLMENTLQVSKLDNVVSLFDLKGSWVDRLSPNDSSTLKDQNLRKMTATGQIRLEMNPIMRKFLHMQLIADVNFFKAHNIMDYSMLVGIVSSNSNSINVEIDKDYAVDEI